MVDMLDQQFGKFDTIRYKGRIGVVLDVIEDSGAYFYNIRMYDPYNNEFDFIIEVPHHELQPF